MGRFAEKPPIALRVGAFAAVAMLLPGYCLVAQAAPPAQNADRVKQEQKDAPKPKGQDVKPGRVEWQWEPAGKPIYYGKKPQGKGWKQIKMHDGKKGWIQPGPTKKTSGWVRIKKSGGEYIMEVRDRHGNWKVTKPKGGWLKAMPGATAPWTGASTIATEEGGKLTISRGKWIQVTPEKVHINPKTGNEPSVVKVGQGQDGWGKIAQGKGDEVKVDPNARKHFNYWIEGGRIAKSKDGWVTFKTDHVLQAQPLRWIKVGDKSLPIREWIPAKQKDSGWVIYRSKDGVTEVRQGDKWVPVKDKPIKPESLRLNSVTTKIDQSPKMEIGPSPIKVDSSRIVTARNHSLLIEPVIGKQQPRITLPIGRLTFVKPVKYRLAPGSVNTKLDSIKPYVWKTSNRKVELQRTFGTPAKFSVPITRLSVGHIQSQQPKPGTAPSAPRPGQQPGALPGQAPPAKGGVGTPPAQPGITLPANPRSTLTPAQGPAPKAPAGKSLAMPGKAPQPPALMPMQGPSGTAPKAPTMLPPPARAIVTKAPHGHRRAKKVHKNHK
jgi:hypothetical protein